VFWKEKHQGKYTYFVIAKQYAKQEHVSTLSKDHSPTWDTEHKRFFCLVEEDPRSKAKEKKKASAKRNKGKLYMFVFSKEKSQG
jgi:hypothetical protein